MRKTLKKALSALLTMVLMLGMITLPVFAETGDGEYIVPEYPSEINTGPAAGGFTNLETTEPWRVESWTGGDPAWCVPYGDGWLIEGRDFTGGFQVDRPNVTIRGCRINGRIIFAAGAAGGVIEYCEINPNTTGVGVTVGAPGVTVRFCDISGVNTGVAIPNLPEGKPVISDNYIHDLYSASGRKEGVSSYGGGSGLTVLHNTISIGSNGYRCVLLANDSPATAYTDTLIENNYFSGGQMMMQYEKPSLVPSNFKLLNNKFSTFYPNAGEWGTWAGPSLNDNGNENSGNVRFTPPNPNATYTVTFNLNYTGATAHPAAQTVKGGETVTEPEVPARDGYEFGGWYKENTGQTKWNFNDGVSENMVLFAKWLGSGTPNLVFTGVEWSPSEPKSGDIVTFFALVRNNGDGAYTGAALQPVLFFNNWDAIGWADSAYTAPIDPGETVRIQISQGGSYEYSGKWLAEEGVYSFILRFNAGSADGQWNGGSMTVGAGSGIPAGAYNPPRAPGNYTALTEWPGASNTGLLQGYTKENLTHIYGPVRPGEVTVDADGREWVPITLNGQPNYNDPNNAPINNNPWTTKRLKYGKTVITQDNTVIENAFIHGGLIIQAKNVVIRNCYIESCSAYWGGGHVDSSTTNGSGAIQISPGASASIINCEIDGIEGEHGGIWNEGNELVALGNNIYNVNDGIFNWHFANTTQGHNFLIQDNWIHDMTNKTSNGHQDGYQTEGTRNGLIYHNYFDMKTEDSGAIAIWNGYDNTQYVMVANNLVNGAGYSVYSQDYHDTYSLSNVWFVGNAFSTKVSSKVGYYGIWFPNGPTDGWTKYDELLGHSRKTLKDNPFAFDPYNFDFRTPSIKFSNYIQETGEIIDGFYEGSDEPDEWPCTGASYVAEGTHEIGSYTGIVTTEFDIVPHKDKADSSVGYTASDKTAAGWSTMAAIFKLSDTGIFDIYNGTGWPLEGKPVGTPGTMAYTVGTKYHVKMVMNLYTQTYDCYVTELDGDGNPVGDPFTVGRNYRFRATAGVQNDIGKCYTVWDFIDTYTVYGHKVVENSWGVFSDDNSSAHSVGKTGGNAVIQFDYFANSVQYQVAMGYLDSSLDLEVPIGSPSLSAFARLNIGFMINPGGVLTVRDAGAWKDSDFPIEEGKLYHFTIDTDIPARTFSLWAAAEGEDAVLIADNYTYRTGSPAINTIGTAAAMCDEGAYNPAANNLARISGHTVVNKMGYLAALAAVNAAEGAEAMEIALRNSALGLSLERFYSLSTADQADLIQYILENKGDGYTGMALVKALDFPFVREVDPDEAAVIADRNALTFDLIKGENASIDAVTKDLNLITAITGGAGSVISWESDNTARIANDGKVTVPASGTEAVVLTATVTKGGYKETKSFTITVGTVATPAKMRIVSIVSEPSPIRVGDYSTWVVRVTNDGGTAASGVWSATLIRDWNYPIGWTAGNFTATLNPGETIEVPINAGNGGWLADTAGRHDLYCELSLNGVLILGAATPGGNTRWYGSFTVEGAIAPPAAYNPPALPGDYTALTEWPNDNNTGYNSALIDGALFGPLRTAADIRGSIEPTASVELPDEHYIPVTFPDNGLEAQYGFDPNPNNTYMLKYGPYVVASDNTVIENKIIYGGVRIQAKNVTLKNCLIIASDGYRAGGYCGANGVVALDSGASATVIGCTLDGGEGIHAGIWNSGSQLIALSNNIYNVNDGIFHWKTMGTGESDNFLLQDNYIHSLTIYTANGHIDGFQTEGSANGLIRHNTIDAGSRGNAAVAIWNSQGTSANIMVNNNLLMGGGYTVYAHHYQGEELYKVQNIWFVDNTFSAKYGKNVGSYGVWFESAKELPYKGGPTDGWNRIDFSWDTFDPLTTPSFRSGNIVLETNENIDNGQPSKDLPVTPEDPTLVTATPSAMVIKEAGNTNTCIITVVELYSDNSNITLTETFTIKNNSSGTFSVGPYKVFVNTKGNDQIRECYIVE